MTNHKNKLSIIHYAAELQNQQPESWLRQPSFSHLRGKVAHNLLFRTTDTAAGTSLGKKRHESPFCRMHDDC